VPKLLITGHDRDIVDVRPAPARRRTCAIPCEP